MCTDSIKDLSYARMPDTMDFVKSMGIGINLGNTLEARPKVPETTRFPIMKPLGTAL